MRDCPHAPRLPLQRVPVVAGSPCAAVHRAAARPDHRLLHQDGTLVASEANRLKVAQPERVRAVISPIDAVPPVSAEARRDARSLIGIPESARVIGTAARLAVQKSPLDMVKAVAALPQKDVYMVWLGDGILRAETERL